MTNDTGQEKARGAAMLEASRREKLKKLEEMGVDPWGGRFDGHAAIGEIRAREGEIVVEPAADGEEGKPQQHGPKVRAAGRIILRRRASLALAWASAVGTLCTAAAASA